MTARIVKEVRLLIPAWGVALLLAMLPLHWLAQGEVAATFNMKFPTIGLLGIGVLLVAVASFGREYNFGTFQLFLSQPCSRKELWRAKTGVLGLVTLSVWLVFWIAFSRGYGFSVWTGALALAGSFGIVGTGLCMTLFLKQVVPAFCFSFLIPAAITPLVWPFFGAEVDPWKLTMLLIALSGYALGSWTWAQWLFLRTEENRAPRFAFAFSSSNAEPSSTTASDHPRRRHGPSVNLVAKELRLQQDNFWWALATFPLLGGIIAFLAFSQKAEALFTAAIGFWLATLFVPILVASVAVAEERKLGTFQAQRCLPVSHRRQFLIKLGVTSAVIVLLGMVLPLLVIGAVFALTGHHLRGDFGTIPLWTVYMVLAGLTAFYASSISRSTLGALLLGTGIVFGAVLFFLLLGEFFVWVTREMGWLPLLWRVGAVGLSLVGLWLAFKNFSRSVRERWQDAPVWGGTVLTVIVVTGLMHYRTWELVMPEWTPGPPEPTLAAGAELHAVQGQILVLLPDGRLWVSEKHSVGKRLNYPEHGRFLEGSDWVKLATNYVEAAAIRADGSLWSVGRWDTHEWQLGRPNLMDGSGRWVSLAGDGTHMLAVKEDGSLWGWGSNFQLQLSGDLPALRIERLTRLGQATDWHQIFAGRSMSIGIRQDGSVWRWGHFFSERERRWTSVSQPERWPEFPEDRIVALSDGRRATAAVLADGTLWSWGMVVWPAMRVPQRLDDRTDWHSVAVGRDRGDRLIALREDGSLWGANMRGESAASFDQLRPEQRLTEHSEWVAVSRVVGPALGALATDGSLWVWEIPSREDPPPLLIPSRRPRPWGNYLQEQIAAWENP